MILFENSDLIVVNKPTNLISYCAINPNKSAVGIISENNIYLRDLPRYGIVHRLDKDSTGLLIIAKNIKSLNILSDLMKARKIKRKYLVLVHGKPKGAGIINCYLRKDHAAGRMRVNNKDGYYSETIYGCKESFKHYTLLECVLNTGRTHQIRVHLELIKHCVVGDLTYNRVKFSSINRQMLHA